ncbi:hypothetical protein [Mesorhizobium sp.]|uniref:hypothetical protein n=1 Tax=Mesorhizobium sp. TaxID=1871066 RepID=UPI0025C0D902|nr:hypothetical protein [Mesorhizobium sp.]
MTPPSLDEIADRLIRLAPSHKDPHRYFEEKSELIAALRWHAANDNRRVERAA